MIITTVQISVFLQLAKHFVRYTTFHFLKLTSMMTSGGSICSLRPQDRFWWGHAQWHCTITTHRKAQFDAKLLFSSHNASDTVNLKKKRPLRVRLDNAIIFISHFQQNCFWILLFYNSPAPSNLNKVQQRGLFSTKGTVSSSQPSLVLFI